MSEDKRNARESISLSHIANQYAFSKKPELRDLLAESYQQIVRYLARRVQLFPGALATRGDLVSFGNMGLLHAIDTYNPAEHETFQMYATHCIIDAMQQGIVETGVAQGYGNEFHTIAKNLPVVDTANLVTELQEELQKDLCDIPAEHRPALEAVLAGATFREAGRLIELGRRQTSKICKAYLNNPEYFIRTREALPSTLQ